MHPWGGPVVVVIELPDPERSKNWNALKRRDVQLSQSPAAVSLFTSLSRIEFGLTLGSTEAQYKNNKEESFRKSSGP